MSARAVVLLSIASCVSSGCVNPNTYSTPRTVPQGGITVTGAFEAFDLRTNTSRLRPWDQRQYAPLPPSVILRYGAGPRTDVGFSMTNFAALGVDVKHNFVRGDVDLAIAPAFQLQPAAVSSLMALHVPVLLGINVSRDVSLVAAAGATGVRATHRFVSDVEASGAALDAEAILARGSLGVDFRLTQSVAFHPEVTMLRGFRHDTTLWLVGLGVTMGRLPSFEPGGE